MYCLTMLSRSVRSSLHSTIIFVQDLFKSDSFAWIVNTSMPTGALKNAELRVPCKFISILKVKQLRSYPISVNSAMLAIKTGNTSFKKNGLTVARRSLNGTSSEKFNPLPQGLQKILESEGRVQVSNLTQLDGQYILLVSSG
jgi:hypothetical protein